jgi:hypothetical protein
MLKREPREVVKVEAKGEKATQTYTTPELVVLGQALELVQGSDLYKMTIDANRQGYHD